MRWYYILISLLSLALLAALLGHLQYKASQNPIVIILNKKVYTQGEEIIIYLINNSDKNLTFTNAVYELIIQHLNTTNYTWEFYTAIPGPNYTMILGPGEESENVLYVLGSEPEKPFPAGTYRVGIERFDIYVEFEVQPSD